MFLSGLNSSMMESRRSHDPAFQTRGLERHVRGVLERARTKTSDCRTLTQLVDAKMLPQLDTLDAWGHPLQLNCEGRHFSLRSAGLDGRFDTSDDVVMTDQHSPEDMPH
ncbi:MAG: hypothetical protein ABI627_01585 [Polyangiaceae bacterium]